MPSADVPSLPPWLTRNYDYAQGFRGIGRGLAQGYENAAVQQQVQARQQALQEQAQIAASRRAGIAQYQQRLQTYMQDPQYQSDPIKAAARAYTETAHMIDPIGFNKFLSTEDRNDIARMKTDMESKFKEINAQRLADKLQADIQLKQQQLEQAKAIAEMRDTTAKQAIGQRQEAATTAETGRNQRSAATLNARIQAAIEKDKVLEGLNDQLSTAQSDVRAFASETPSLLGKTGVAGRTKAAIAADLAKAKKDVADIQRQINKRQSELRSRLKATPEGEEPADTPEETAPESNDPLGIRGLMK